MYVVVAPFLGGVDVTTTHAAAGAEEIRDLWAILVLAALGDGSLGRHGRNTTRPRTRRAFPDTGGRCEDLLETVVDAQPESARIRAMLAADDHEIP